MTNAATLPEPAFRKKYRNLAEAVVESISATIHSGALKPGDKLPTESAIMQQCGVSRTVVREAISHLQAAGLVKTRHGIGTFVLDKPAAPIGIARERIVTQDEVQEIYEFRISLESEAAWLAASRRSEGQLADLRRLLAEMSNPSGSAEAHRHFHFLIAQATGNRYFVDLLKQLGSAICPHGQSRPAAYLERVQREHEDIVSAIARNDPDGARAAMRTHLSNSRERQRLPHAA